VKRHSPNRREHVMLLALVALMVIACSSPPSSESRRAPAQDVVMDTPTPTRTATPVPPPPTAITAPQSPGSISWNEAGRYVGEHGTVCGQVVSTSYRSDINGGPTWLNVGRNYPDSSRFQVVIWERHRGNFPQAPEVLYRGETICATGKIDLYRGVAEMEVSGSGSIVIQ